MILEVATLDVKLGKQDQFESKFAEAQEIISSMPGYISHQLHRNMENKNRYILLVNWEKLTDHTVGFRQSERYNEWSALLHNFYDPFPEVEHYDVLFSNGI